ncbi:MAG: hypothetical protein KBF88_06385 [Polyangiaceae bacterium]|nr:hypothetical protein [Polyangiaceae bacterium]
MPLSRFPKQLIVAAVCCTAVWDAPLVAQPATYFGTKEDPFHIEAEKVEVDIHSGEAALTGNVTLQKGPLKVSCPKVDLKFDGAPHVLWAKGSGGVVAEIKGVRGEAPEAELDMKKHVLELRGGVKLTRGSTWVQAESASIDVASAKVTLFQVKGSMPVPK